MYTNESKYVFDEDTAIENKSMIYNSRLFTITGCSVPKFSTRSHGGGKIVYFEAYDTIGNAMRREIEVKKWPRAKKLALIKTLRQGL
jgi:predicted GIY-YIG superfamily endonuclease